MNYEQGLAIIQGQGSASSSSTPASNPFKFYENSRNSAPRITKQTIILDSHYKSTNSDGEIIYERWTTNNTTSTTFSCRLQEPLRIDSLSEVYLDNFTTYDAPRNTSAGHGETEPTSSYQFFCLDINEFNIQTNSPNPNMFNKVVIPNEETQSSVEHGGEATITGVDMTGAKVEITALGHGFSTDDIVVVTEVPGGSSSGAILTVLALNTSYKVKKKDADTFQIKDKDGKDISTTGTYDSGGKIGKHIDHLQVHKARKHNFICNVNPQTLTQLSGTITGTDGLSICQDDGFRFVAEFVIVTKE